MINFEDNFYKFIAPYMTEADKRELQRRDEQLLNPQESAGQYDTLLNERNDIIEEFCLKYLQERGQSGLYEDAAEIIANTTHKDFILNLKTRQDHLKQLADEGDKGAKKLLKKTSDDLANAIVFLSFSCKMQLNLANEETAEKIHALILETVQSWYIPNSFKTAPRSDNYSMSIDKNYKIFNPSLLVPKKQDIEGQMLFTEIFQVSEDRKKPGLKYDNENKLFINYCFWFENIAEIDKRLTDIDFFIMQTLSNLKDDGNEIISMSMLCKCLGMKNPTTKQRDRIQKEVLKLNNTKIHIDDKQFNIGKGNNTYFAGDYTLLPYQIVQERAVIDDKIVNLYIDLKSHREKPILIKIAERGGHITTTPRALLENNISKTDKYFTCLYYLTRRISEEYYRYKKSNGKPWVKIVYNTLFEEYNIKDRRDKASIKKTMSELAQYFANYSKNNSWWIKSCTANNDYINIHFSEKKELPTL